MENNEIYIDGVDVSGCEHLYGDDSCDVLELPSIYCAKNNCRYKEFKHLQRENKEKIDIIEQMIKILYPNASDDELYDVTFNGEYIDKLKELKDTSDTMLMANDIKKQDIDSLREVNERLEQENKELKEWKTKVVKLFESACRCKYLNEETDICSYTNEKCININKCVYKYQELSDIYRSALEEIRELTVIGVNASQCNCGLRALADDILNEINKVLNS